MNEDNKSVLSINAFILVITQSAYVADTLRFLCLRIEEFLDIWIDGKIYGNPHILIEQSVEREGIALVT